MIELENRKSSATMLNNSNSNSTTEVFDVDNTSTANVESLQQQCASSAGSTNNPENSTAATPLDYDIEKCSDRERLDTGETDESVVDSQSPRQQQQQQLEPNVTIIDSNNDDDRTTIVTTYCFTKRVCCLRIVLFFLILGIVVFIITDTMTNGYIKTFIFNFLQWIEDNPVSGIFIYTLGTYINNDNEHTILFCFSVCF